MLSICLNSCVYTINLGKAVSPSAANFTKFTDCPNPLPCLDAALILMEAVSIIKLSDGTNIVSIEDFILLKPVVTALVPVPTVALMA